MGCGPLLIGLILRRETRPRGHFALWGRTSTCAAHTSSIGRVGCYWMGRLHAGKGAGRRLSIRRRISANRGLGTRRPVMLRMSAMGQKRKSEATPGMSAPGGEADVDLNRQLCPLLARSGHSVGYEFQQVSMENQ